jgi:biopolymer transport protein ExbB/TolQ
MEMTLTDSNQFIATGITGALVAIAIGLLLTVIFTAAFTASNTLTKKFFNR